MGVGLTACSRYEYVPDYMTPPCRAAVAPRQGPHIITVSDSVSPGVVIGTVTTPSGDPVPYAVVVLDQTHADSTDDRGVFRLEHVPPGNHAIAVRSIGYNASRDSVAIGLRGSILKAQLELRTMDGPCSGYASVRVRKPWWKVW